MDSQADFVRTLRDSLERNDAELFMSTFDALASQLDDLIEGFGGQEDEEEVSRQPDFGDAAPSNADGFRNQIASLESIRYA